MKKVLFIIISIIALSTTANAQRLFSKEWKLQQLGKDSISLANKEKEKIAKAEKKIKLNDLDKNGIITAGKYLKKSANYQYGAVACFVAGGGAAIGAAYIDKKESRNIMLITGGGVAAIGFILQLKAIDYKFKSGNILEFTGDKVTLKF